MGYCTTFRLTWTPLGDEHATVARCKHSAKTGHKYCPECGQSTKRQDVNEAIKIWIALQKSGSIFSFFGVNTDGTTTESCRWYEWASEVGALSKQFPYVLFQLEGEGEESGDLWRAYFRAGKVQKVKAIVTFPDLDFSKMGPPEVL